MLHNVFGKHGHKRRRSMRQDRSMSHKLWKVATPMNGLCQPSCARCPVWKDKRCPNAWREIYHTIDVSAKGASKLPDCGKRWPCGYWQTWRKIGQGKMGAVLDLEGQGAPQRCSFMSTDNFWIMSHSKSLGTDAE